MFALTVLRSIVLYFLVGGIIVTSTRTRTAEEIWKEACEEARKIYGEVKAKYT